MARPLSPADIPVAAWPHINALPALWAARQRLISEVHRRHARTRSYWLQMSRLADVSREALCREAALTRLGISPAMVKALSATPARHWTEVADA